MKRRLRAPSPALVISLIALFIALGGTSYAAINALPKNSVGTKQLKKNAVTGAKIKNGAVTAAKINPSGLTVPNATSATSATNATNATNATTAANANALGGHAASYFATATLHAGQSESGVWIDAAGDSTSDFAGDGIAFPIPLAAALDAAHVDYVGTSTDSHCAGFGHAAPGFLCIYAHLTENMTVGAFNHLGLTGSDPYGFFMGGVLTGAAPALAYGSWTVTAPVGALVHAQTHGTQGSSQFGAVSH
jgi:hypothetical protein